MKFTDYILEEKMTTDKIAKKIVDACSPFLKEFIKFKKDDFLYRGSSDNSADITKKSSHLDNRHPALTLLEIHDKLNTKFEEKFGWKVRNGVSVSPYIYTSCVYGNPHLFFPIGKYKYAWSPKIHDLTLHTASVLSDKEIDNIVKTYINSRLERSFTYSSKPEIMFMCSSYYIVNVDRKDTLKEEIKKLM
jgi:hypothetical protein